MSKYRWAHLDIRALSRWDPREYSETGFDRDRARLSLPGSDWKMIIKNKNWWAATRGTTILIAWVVE